MCNETTTAAGPSLHPFEKAGLGKAPFRYVGMSREVGPIRGTCPKTGLEYSIGAPGQPMGTCDYCGQGIANVFRVRGADGREFKVGCDCVAKVYREYGREASDPIQRQIDRDRKAYESKVRKDRQTAKMAEARAWFTENRSTLEAMPNPSRPGESQWDRVDWFYRHAGARGLLDLHRQLVKLMTQ